MQPPPVPPVVTIPTTQSNPTPENASPVTPSQEEAARALELVMNFFQQQPQGFVEPQEYVMIGKLMEKLKIKRSEESLSTLRHLSESDFGLVGKIESVDAVH